MRIKDITVWSFRGFKERQSFSLDPKMTVAIGNNGAGKSSLIYAVQVAVGAFLQSMRLLPAQRLYRRQFAKSDRYISFSDVKRSFIASEVNPHVEVNAEMDENISLSWWRELTSGGTTTHNRECAGDLIDYVSGLEKRWLNNSEAIFPVLLSFGTNRLNAQVRKGRNVKNKLNRLEKGYLAALGNKVDFEGSVEWLYHYERNIRDGREYEGTLEALYEALETAIPYLSDINFNTYYNQLDALVTIDGKSERLLMENMSDGLNAMVNVVCETAYRCIELNGWMGREAVKRTPGVVMIDEIDMHLHPKWQRRVLEDLQNAFPCIQFIVTTHSPFIVQSVGRENIVSFDDNDWAGDPSMMSLEEVAEAPMNMPEERRSKRYDDMLEAAEEYHRAVMNKAGNLNEIKQAFDRLALEFSDDPAYVALMKAKMGLL